MFFRALSSTDCILEADVVEDESPLWFGFVVFVFSLTTDLDIDTCEEDVCRVGNRFLRT